MSKQARSPARIHSCNTAPTPAGFAEIVSDDFPSTSREAIRRVYDAAVNLIETHEHTGDFNEW
jgi:hypothetical protein